MKVTGSHTGRSCCYREHLITSDTLHRREFQIVPNHYEMFKIKKISATLLKKLPIFQRKIKQKGQLTLKTTYSNMFLNFW